MVDSTSIINKVKPWENFKGPNSFFLPVVRIDSNKEIEIRSMFKKLSKTHTYNAAS